MSYIGNQPYQVAFLTDQFSGNGSTTAFTMSVAPANTSSVLVVVSGVVQDPSTYSVSGTTLTFSQAPPTGTGNISARYLGIPASNVTTTAYRTVTNFTATSGQTTFTPPSYTAGFINVYRNGVYLPTTDYTASNGTTVVLNNGCTTGDTVTVESFLVSSVLNAIPNSPASVGSSNIVAGAVGTTQLASGSVTQSILGTNVAGNGPAFSYYPSSGQSITNATYTKVLFQTKEWDTNNNFTSSTFTPTVAGYYNFNSTVERTSAAFTGECVLVFYKNGSAARYVYDLNVTSYCMSGSTNLYMNGTTDYVEVYMYQGTGGAITLNASSNSTNFSGFLARSA